MDEWKNISLLRSVHCAVLLAFYIILVLFTYYGKGGASDNSGTSHLKTSYL